MTEAHVIWNYRIIILKRPINKLFLAEFSNQHDIEPTFINEKITGCCGGQCSTRVNFAYGDTWLFI